MEIEIEIREGDIETGKQLVLGQVMRHPSQAGSRNHSRQDSTPTPEGTARMNGAAVMHGGGTDRSNHHRLDVVIPRDTCRPRRLSLGAASRDI